MTDIYTGQSIFNRPTMTKQNEKCLQNVYVKMSILSRQYKDCAEFMTNAIVQCQYVMNII